MFYQVLIKGRGICPSKKKKIPLAPASLMTDARNKKLKEAAQGYCLKEVQVFSSDVKDAQWNCPFCFIKF
jgi:hypothetical protein